MFELLNQPYSLTKEQIIFFKKNRFIKLRDVFSKELIDHFNTTISRVVDRLNTQEIPLEKRDAYGKAFLQLFNLWRESDEVKSFCFSKRLAKIAFERGPLVYCAEEVDNPNGVLDLKLDANSQFKYFFDNKLLGGMGKIIGKATDGNNKLVDFIAIPYYAWAHRDDGEMSVWLNSK